VILLHIIFLHKTGSSNPTGVSESVDKLEFHSEFTNKDIMYIILVSMASFLLISNIPNVFIDVENMNESNPIKAPVHIQPEWYFLFAYAILRSIPSKLGGVIALVASVVLFYFLPLKMKKSRRTKFSPNSYRKLIIFSLSFLSLTFIGRKPVERPYDTFGKFVAIVYFLFFIY
jgi:ubiquinol-cytochrome c reductase cytochrome b subunit